MYYSFYIWVGDRMDLKQLQYFATVAKEGNISKAAKALHISQPPLSIQLKHLEEELGCVLFERGAREVELTEAGLLLYNRALSLLELSAITVQEISDLKNQTAGTLRLGAVSSVGSTLLNAWIVDLNKEYPDIHYEIFEGNTYEQIEQLKNHTIELAIVRSPFSTNDMHVIPLRTEPMMAVGNERFFSSSSDEIPLLGGYDPLCVFQAAALLSDLLQKRGRKDDAALGGRRAWDRHCPEIRRLPDPKTGHCLQKNSRCGTCIPHLPCIPRKSLSLRACEALFKLPHHASLRRLILLFYLRPLHTADLIDLLQFLVRKARRADDL